MPNLLSINWNRTGQNEADYFLTNLPGFSGTENIPYHISTYSSEWKFSDDFRGSTKAWNKKDFMKKT